MLLVEAKKISTSAVNQWNTLSIFKTESRLYQYLLPALKLVSPMVRLELAL